MCVVGTGWGSFHCNLLRKASPTTRLFVCGQNPDKTARLAKAVKADDYFLGLLWPGASYIDLYPVDPPLIPRLLSYVRPYWLQEKLMRPQFGRVRISLPEREGTGYPGEIREFLAAVAEEREPASPAEDGRRDLEIVLRCYDALAKGGKVRIEPVGLKSSSL